MDIDIDPITAGSSAGTSATASTAPTLVQPIATSKSKRLIESLKLEYQLLRLPFELYQKTIRSNHRIADKELSSVIAGVGEAAKKDFTKDEAVNLLGSLVSRLQGLEKKVLLEGGKVEDQQSQRCMARFDYLESAGSMKLSEWNNSKLNRILVDYMLRTFNFDTAVKLAQTANLMDLVDIDVFYEAKNVVDALYNEDVGPALAWCADNKSRMKKLKSTFEFQLRLQEFVEFVRAENSMRAITYARKYLAPWGTTHMKELQRVAATLAFKNNTECAKYKVLYEENQWAVLVELFYREFCLLYGMTIAPLLNIYLQAGLSALKTPFCGEDVCPKEDPLSQESFRELARYLPFSKPHHSKLACYITKELMDTENPPWVLPNGYVYGTKGLAEMAMKNIGRITCPKTGLVCTNTDLVKAYIS